MVRNAFLTIAMLILSPAVLAAGITELCLDGEFDLGARYQGMDPGSTEFVPTRWCVISEDGSNRVIFTGNGKSNPDMDGGWRVALVPGLVRIINAEDPPDVEFRGADTRDEALRVRRIDPRRLLEEHRRSPIAALHIDIDDDRLSSVTTSADLPLRGRVPVTWQWDWPSDDAPALSIDLEGKTVFRARGSWRKIDVTEAAELWQATPGAEPVEIPGDRWPATINMRRIDLADGVHLVRGVRSGFQHLVVDTEEGLVIADAPAGWVELHQLPPADLVPGLGISGLSEQFVDFLAEAFPGRPILAVALTHAHDDHAGGARAFAARQAAIYAPAEYAPFLESALNRPTMPRDRLAGADGSVRVVPVSKDVILGNPRDPVRLVAIGAGPHASASLGVYAVNQGFFFVSDLHVPDSEDDVPRADRIVTECWFAGWAVANLPAETLVVNSHSAPQTPVSRLARYLESPRCQQLNG
jgi:glyoxylase-like metal-dependent hydrolase (beta-lactamase superfamily II)